MGVLWSREQVSVFAEHVLGDPGKSSFGGSGQVDRQVGEGDACGVAFTEQTGLSR